MKSILMSIKPKFVEKIANGEKTVEVRKTAPKLEVPFKCYIYCTKGKPCLKISYFDKKSCFSFYGYSYKEAKEIFEDDLWNGSVIGEFVCDEVIEICFECSDWSKLRPAKIPCTGLTDKEIVEYLGNGKSGYGLHISDLKIYDKPKELSKFRKPCDAFLDCLSCRMGKIADLSCKGQLTRPPQSWQYGEEL